MLKSIQWKLVIISFLLVWLAMSIVGVYITEQFKSTQMEIMQDTAKTSAMRFAETLGSYLDRASETSKTFDIQEKGEDWFLSQGPHIRSVAIFSGTDVVYKNKKFEDYRSYIIVQLEEVYKRQTELSEKDDSDEYYIYNTIPIRSGIDNRIIGALYVGVDLSSSEESIKGIRSMLTNATFLALSITVLLGIVLARTITEPIKEVTSKAEKMAKGDYGQVITVKSNDEVGQLTQMFNYMSSRLKNTLEEVFNEKNKVDTIVTHMTDGIIAVNNHGKIIHANPAVFGIFNIEEQELENSSFDDFAKEYGLSITTEELFNGSEKNHNIISINKSIIKMNVEPFKNEKNEINGVIVVLQDVTEQEKLDKMRKEFVANVSHELRTPLTTIKSYTETLLDGALENKEYTINFLNVINSESDRMTRLVKDLLQLSKLDYDNIQWNMREINLTSILQECLYKMDISAKQKGQKLTFESEADKLEGFGDKDRIEQVIINIISNAIKYTPENGEIKVMTANDKEYNVITVTDTGIGIPKEDIPRLFERFYRVDKARSRAMGGTGLGLSIAKQIVEAHKGYIKIESEYGKGTQVIIGLPQKSTSKA